MRWNRERSRRQRLCQRVRADGAFLCVPCLSAEPFIAVRDWFACMTDSISWSWLRVKGSRLICNKIRAHESVKGTSTCSQPSERVCLPHTQTVTFPCGRRVECMSSLSCVCAWQPFPETTVLDKTDFEHTRASGTHQNIHSSMNVSVFHTQTVVLDKRGRVECTS